MSRLSLRTRVAASIAAINLAVILVAGWVLVSNAREATQAEIRASVELAKKLTLSAIGALVRSGEPDAVLADLPIQLQRPRHVRIGVLNGRDELIAGPAPAGAPGHDAGHLPPDWFASWIRPPIKIIRIPVTVQGRTYGSVVITTAPADEIKEAWEDFRDLFLLMAAAYLTVLLAVYWALGQALKPLATISRGLLRLEDRSYSTRLPPIPVPDLRELGVRFNAMASTLETSICEKEALSQQLITVEDTERKNIALELHDEIGPCLFGMKVDATYLESQARQRMGKDGEAMAERARSILEIVEHMQKQNRTLLQRLGPMALGHVPLTRLLNDLAGGIRLHGAAREMEISVPEGLRSCGETADLTIYRVIQECLTNAVRHAGARRISVAVEIDDGGDTGRQGYIVRVRVADDGRGVPPESSPGRGLTGMSQRVRGLGGTLEIKAAEGGGTVVRAAIPVATIDYMESAAEAALAGDGTV